MAYSISNLFDTSSTNSTNSIYSLLGGNGSGANLLSDYAMIKSGTYKRLLKEYYASTSSTSKKAQTGSSTVATQATTAAEEAQTKQQVEEYGKIKEASTKLKATAENIRNSKTLFEKTTLKEGDTEVEDYDREKIYGAVKDFVTDYNSVLDEVSETDNLTILRKGVFMTTTTASNQKLLSSVGVTVGENNKLSVSQAKIEGADINELKTLFSGWESYGSTVAQKASDIYTLAGNAAAKLTSATYNNSGVYASLTTGSIYDSLS